MREIQTSLIREKLKTIVNTTLTEMPNEAYQKLLRARDEEENETGRFALDVILKNAEIAKQKRRPLCQDTGMAVLFIEIGQDVHLSGGYLEDELNAAIAESYLEGCFRMSVLTPLTRENTKTNTPAIIHTRIVPGDTFTLYFLPKGFGSENMTKTYMLTPAAGIQGVENAVVDAVKNAASSPCPPVVVGVGIGGTLDKAAELSKIALLRPVGTASQDPLVCEMESRLLETINRLGIGAQGFGGNHTALSVAIETFPTHIAGLPVCVSLQCHSVRVGRFSL